MFHARALARLAMQMLATTALVAALPGCRESRSRPVESAENSDLQSSTSELVHDFGIVAPGQQLSATVPIQNPTQRELRVSGLRRSCSCANASLSSRTIAPQSAISLNVRYLAPMMASDERRHIEVMFSDRAVSPLRVTVKAQVRPPLTVATDEINMGDVLAGTSKEMVFPVYNYSRLDWDGLDVKADSSSWLRAAAMEPMTESVLQSNTLQLRQTFNVRVICDSHSLPPGIHVARVVLVTEGNEKLEQAVAVVARVVQPIRASPDLLFLGKLESHQECKRVIRLVLASGIASRITPEDVTVAFSDPLWSAEVSATSVPTVLTVTVFGRPSSVGNYRNEVTISVSREREGVHEPLLLTVPLLGMVTE